MALVFTSRASDPDDTDATSYTTPSFTPSASAGIVVVVQTSKGLNPDLPTLDVPTWLNGAWTQELDTTAASLAFRLTIFSGKTISSPGSDDVIADYSGVTQTACSIQVFDVTGQDASDFVLQPKISAPVPGDTSASLSLDGSLAGADSACVGIFAIGNNSALSPTGGETELVETTSALRNVSTQYEINDTTSGVSWGTTANYIAAVLEVKAAGEAPPVSAGNLAPVIAGYGAM